MYTKRKSTYGECDEDEQDKNQSKHYKRKVVRSTDKSPYYDTASMDIKHPSHFLFHRSNPSKMENLAAERSV